MIALLCFLLTLLVSPFKPKSRLEAENVVLRHQLIILRRKVRGRVHLSNGDRFFFVQLYRAAADLIATEGLEATHPHAPATAMYCQAVELYLKSFLRLHRVSAIRLRWISHDFRKLLSRARSYGLALSEHDDVIINSIASEDLFARARYLKTGPLGSLPTQTFSETCRALKQSVGEALRAAGEPVRMPSHRKPW